MLSAKRKYVAVGLSTGKGKINSIRKGENVRATLVARDTVKPLISKDRHSTRQRFLERDWKRSRRFHRDELQMWLAASDRKSQARLAWRDQDGKTERVLQPALARFFRILYSAFATFIRRSSSLIGIQDVNTFMAFSKSESSKISLVASISAAEVACSTSKSPLKFVEDVVE